MMRSFLGIGALEASSCVVSVSVTMVVLSSSSRGLLDMEEVPGVAETRDDTYDFCLDFSLILRKKKTVSNK